MDQDQDDETEESAGMDNDEINNIVAHSEAELILFHEMDIQRAAQEQKDWHRQVTQVMSHLVSCRSASFPRFINEMSQFMLSSLRVKDLLGMAHRCRMWYAIPMVLQTTSGLRCAELIFIFWFH